MTQRILQVQQITQRLPPRTISPVFVSIEHLFCLKLY